MPTIATTTIFPSARYITTDGLGDLQEAAPVPAVASTLTFDGLTFTAATAGAAGDGITITLNELQGGVTGVEVSVIGTDISINTENAATTYTQGDVETAYNLVTAATDLASITVASAGTSLTATQATTNLAGGADEIAGDLEGNATYLCINQDELHDLLDSEQSDGRKFVWSVVHAAAEVFEDLTEQPDNLTLTKSSLVSVDSGAALRQVYTLTAKYDIGNLDLKDETA